MNLLGDLERLFATSLYPNRVPIAIGLALLAAALIVAAHRRGWFGAARRHPRRTGAIVALVLAIGLPTAWYLGSPLVIRTSLIEPAPTDVIPASTPTTGPSMGPPPVLSEAPPDVTPAPPTPTPAPLAAPRTGTFRGADEFHFGSGTATLIETQPGRWTVRFEGFSVRNGPDLFVYASPDGGGYSDEAIELGRLKATDGSFNMDLPPGADPTGAASVVIWCKQFAVLFAVAPFEG